MDSDIRELLDTLKEAEEFINRHSEPWYMSGQALLSKIQAVIKRFDRPNDRSEVIRLRGALITGASLLERGCDAKDLAALLRKSATTVIDPDIKES